MLPVIRVAGTGGGQSGRKELASTLLGTPNLRNSLKLSKTDIVGSVRGIPNALECCLPVSSLLCLKVMTS